MRKSQVLILAFGRGVNSSSKLGDFDTDVTGYNQHTTACLSIGFFDACLLGQLCGALNACKFSAIDLHLEISEDNTDEEVQLRLDHQLGDAWTDFPSTKEKGQL